jgi:plasmid maintenance system antidote protein VapI
MTSWREKRGITTDTALRLARFFGGDAGSWLNLQRDYDLKLTERAMSKIINAEVTPLEQNGNDARFTLAA